MSQHADNEGRTCWICLDGGTDEGGRSLVRECSCRGSAGYVHASCLIGYAQHKTKVNYESHPIINNLKHAMHFRQPWEVCPNCEQYYDDKGCLSQELASAFVAFVEENYEDNIAYNLEALLLKLEAQSRKSNIDVTLNIGISNIVDATQNIGSEMISIIEQ